MEITLTTPALLFPALSLLLLAFTNRFLSLANLIRNLKGVYQTNRSHLVYGQIQNLRIRLILIRNMQAFGTASMFSCVLCMFMVYAGLQTAGKIVFGVSLVLLMISMALSLWEIQISVKALELELSDLEHEEEKAPVPAPR
ncbi:DUF2721 domain-containing protein [Rufibacter glacialis]|uniref:DUF2721 domain-containing protein n=1 Tax=Rufibacter glacialis TaxID=1259555 RepID=A0A5M8QIJ5_9BACT|nr:DUF2721 domain-containing protein [Rufibacter glacialis]KAA6435855.1 DUF2721 domain-containing protein [Rufibacter glacialis]GGK67140.1 hypothetical protein GCM10011405_13890 [Rufibacter glacialis]